MVIGAQTYTVRAYTQNESDFREAIKRISAIGYQEVQLSAVGPIAPRILRQVCEQNGLAIVLTHTAPERILQDVEEVIREHSTLGCRYVGIGSMPERYRTAEWIDMFAKDFMEPAKKLRDAGMLLMYHNHNFEWERLPDGRVMLQVLLDAMPSELMGVTLDTYWVQAAGADIIEWIERLGDRIPCVHLKDMSVKGFEQRMAAVGEGNINFAKVLAALERNGRTKHILVEQDHCYGKNPFDCLASSYTYLKEKGFQ